MLFIVLIKKQSNFLQAIEIKQQDVLFTWKNVIVSRKKSYTTMERLSQYSINHSRDIIMNC